MVSLCYNKYNKEREKEVIKMMTFTIKHKYCGMTKKVSGYNVFDAFKTNGLDLKVWEVISVEK